MAEETTNSAGKKKRLERVRGSERVRASVCIPGMQQRSGAAAAAAAVVRVSATRTNNKHISKNLLSLIIDY